MTNDSKSNEARSPVSPAEGADDILPHNADKPDAKPRSGESPESSDENGSDKREPGA